MKEIQTQTDNGEFTAKVSNAHNDNDNDRGTKNEIEHKQDKGGGKTAIADEKMNEQCLSPVKSSSFDNRSPGSVPQDDDQHYSEFECDEKNDTNIIKTSDNRSAIIHPLTDSNLHHPPAPAAHSSSCSSSHVVDEEKRDESQSLVISESLLSVYDPIIPSPRSWLIAKNAAEAARKKEERQKGKAEAVSRERRIRAAKKAFAEWKKQRDAAFRTKKEEKKKKKMEEERRIEKEKAEQKDRSEKAVARHLRQKAKEDAEREKREEKEREKARIEAIKRRKANKKQFEEWKKKKKEIIAQIITRQKEEREKLIRDAHSDNDDDESHHENNRPFIQSISRSSSNDYLNEKIRPSFSKKKKKKNQSQIIGASTHSANNGKMSLKVYFDPPPIINTNNNDAQSSQINESDPFVIPMSPSSSSD